MKVLPDNVFKLLCRLLPVLTLVLVAGCETPPPSASVVQPWPGPPPAGYSMLMLYRQGRPAVSPSIFIDDVKVLKLEYNSYTWVYVREGRHVIQGKFPFPFHGLNIGGEAKFEAGHNYYLKFNVWNGGGYPVAKIYSALVPETEPTGTAEAKRCWFHKPLVLQIGSSGKEADKAGATNPPVTPQEPAPPTSSFSNAP